jgi:NAD(P)-dependent dehydrogenase (short-subunit alcohol dehydrogenase family)
MTQKMFPDKVMMDLTGQVALITGGSRGLGRAFAQALLAAGARVAITGRTAPELHETAMQLSSAANQVLAIPADATDLQGAPQIVTTVEQRLGPITLLINTAGQNRAFGPIGVVDPSHGGTKCFWRNATRRVGRDQAWRKEGGSSISPKLVLVMFCPRWRECSPIQIVWPSSDR